MTLTTDGIAGSRATTKECIDGARERLETLRAEQLRRASGAPTHEEAEQAMAAVREYAIAITALEDAAMRLNRGLTKAAGIYNEVDLQKPDGIERAKADHAANVAGNQAGPPQRS